MKKHFISANDLLIDSFKLAKLIYDSGFQPHFIVGVWRGGAPVGIAVQEFLDFHGVKTNHIAIRTSSYCGIDKQNKEIRVHAMDYLIENVRPEENLLLVDDVFDSGRSIQAVIDNLRVRAKGNTPNSIKIACPWYKPARNITDIEPDFYIHTTDKWLVFPHELQGLTAEEIAQGKGEEIADLIG